MRKPLGVATDEIRVQLLIAVRDMRRGRDISLGERRSLANSIGTLATRCRIVRTAVVLVRSSVLA
jgi:hypothetical protein